MINACGKTAVGKIYVTNTINENNIEKARVAYKYNDLYIDRKFPIPSTNWQGADGSEVDEIINHVQLLANKSGLNETVVKNLQLKVKYWLSEDGILYPILKKVDAKHANINVFIDNSLSKHEWYIVEALSAMGVNFFIISDTKPVDKILSGNEVFDSQDDTGAMFNYKVSDKDIKDFQKTSGKLESLQDIIIDFNSPVRISNLYVKGIDNNESSIKSLSELLKTNSQGYVVIKDKIDSTIKSDLVPELKNANVTTQMILDIIPRMINKIDPTGYVDRNMLKDVISEELKGLALKLNGSQLKNKFIVIISALSKILSTGKTTHLIFYGNASQNDAITLDILTSINKINILIIDTDKSRTINTHKINVIELRDSVPKDELKLDNHVGEVASTLAASVEKSVNATLFTGDTPGMYKPGQFNEIKCIRLKTTFDEIKIWLHEDAYLRPGYSSTNNCVTLPTMFKVIIGVDKTAENTYKEYGVYVTSLLSNDTILFRSMHELDSTLSNMSFSNSGLHNQMMKINHYTDVSDTFDKQVPFFENNKIMHDRIKQCSHYNYGFLPESKQKLILDAIELVLNSNYIDYKSYGMNEETYVNCVLQLLLTLHIDLLNAIHSSTYHSSIPRMVVVAGDTDSMHLKNNIKSLILLVFLSIIGFDILLFVPTGYNIVDSKLSGDFIYDKHIIGEPVVDADTLRYITNYIGKPEFMVNNRVGYNTHQEKDKKSWFKRLFNK